MRCYLPRSRHIRNRVSIRFLVRERRCRRACSKASRSESHVWRKRLQYQTETQGRRTSAVHPAAVLFANTTRCRCFLSVSIKQRLRISNLTSAAAVDRLQSSSEGSCSPPSSTSFGARGHSSLIRLRSLAASSSWYASRSRTAFSVFDGVGSSVIPQCSTGASCERHATAPTTKPLT